MGGGGGVSETQAQQQRHDAVGITEASEHQLKAQRPERTAGETPSGRGPAAAISAVGSTENLWPPEETKPHAKAQNVKLKTGRRADECQAAPRERGFDLPTRIDSLSCFPFLSILVLRSQTTNLLTDWNGRVTLLAPPCFSLPLCPWRL